MRESDEQMIQSDALYWAHIKQLNLRDGIKFSLQGRKYLCDLVNKGKRISNIKKGTQIGATTAKYLEAVHGCLYRRFNQNIMYMMPTVKAVENLAKVSFDPIFDYNPWLAKSVGTNSASQKEINGRSIVFVGAQPQKVGGTTKDSANLRSISCDAVYRDELDLMDMDMVEMSKQRLNASEFRYEVNFGSPTYPGYGIAQLYDDSDQGKWQIECGNCRKFTCLVEVWPKSVIKVNGKWIRACKHCHKEIFVQDGSWQHDYPERREAGYWIDGLISPMADLEEYMFRYDNSDGTKRAEFERSILGREAAIKEEQLTIQNVYDTCTNEPMRGYSSCETAMGVDVGKHALHCVTGIRTGAKTYDVMNVSSVSGFNDVHDLALKMNTKFSVIDSLPDTHAVRDFAKAEPYTVRLCQYNESKISDPVWDSNTGVVKANRNDWMDGVNEVFIKNLIRIPRRSEQIDEYALQLTKTAKVNIVHPETGEKKPRWIKLAGGDDHYYHSTLYFMLAASRTAARKNANTETKRYTTQINKLTSRVR